MKSILPRHHSRSKWTCLPDFGQSASETDHALDSINMHLTHVQIPFSMLEVVMRQH